MKHYSTIFLFLSIPFILISCSKESLWGTWESTAEKNAGVIFSIDKNGEDYKIQHIFSGIDGQKPAGSLILYKNYLYGVTSEGGKDNKGVIFRISSKTSEYEKLADLSDYGIHYPTGGLALSQAGLFYGFSERSSPGISHIYSFNPKTNKINKLVSFLPDYYEETDSSLLNYKSEIFIRSSYDNPIENAENTPIIDNNILYGYFKANTHPKYGGILSLDLVKNEFKIIEYFSSAAGNFLITKDSLLYPVADPSPGSTLKADSFFFKEGKRGPAGHINKDVFNNIYYFPYTWDMLFKKSPHKIPELVMTFGRTYSITNEMKDSLTTISDGYKLNLAKVFVSDDENNLTELDAINVDITGSVFKGPMLHTLDNNFYGMTAFGGKYNHGIFFMYNAAENKFINLYNFREGEKDYPSYPASLTIVK